MRELAFNAISQVSSGSIHPGKGLDANSGSNGDWEWDDGLRN